MNKISLFCPSCSSKGIVKAGIRKNKQQEIQRYKCNSCNKTFTSSNLKNKTYQAKIILNAISYCNLGYSQQQASKIISQKFKIKAPQRTISEWQKQYRNICTFARLRKQAIKLYSPKSIILEKSLNHIEMWILVDGARKGDRKAAQALAEYTVNDGKAEFALGKYYLETLARKSMLFRRDPDSMCATKRTTNADDRWKRRYFFKMHTFRDRYQVRAMKAAQQREEEFEFIPELKYDKYSLLIFPRDETGRFITQDGFFDGISTVYIIPYVSALGLLINQFPDAMDFLRKMKREKDPRLKFDMAKTLNAYINQPMIELERAITRAGFNLGDCVNSPHDIPQDMDVIDWAFGQEYRLDYIGGERNTNFMTLNNNLFFWKIRANQLLKNAELINYSENFLFLRNVDVGELEQQGIAVDMGSGPVISQKDFVIANASGKYIYSGIGITRRIRYDFGRDLIFDFIEGALNLKSEEELYAMLKGGIEKLESGGVPKTRLVYKSMDRECMTEKGPTELGYAEFIWTDNLPPDYQFYRSQFLKFTDLFQLVMPTYHPFAIDLLHGKRNLFT